MRVLFRTDCSAKIGMGHLIRCRSLARTLKLDSVEVIFIGNLEESRLTSQFKKEFKVYDLQPSNKKQIIKKSWLNCSEVEDIGLTSKLIKEKKLHPFDWLIIDQYGISEEWEKIFKINFPETKLCVVDDLANRKHIANILIDHNYYGNSGPLRYKSLVPKDCKLCIGPQFSLIDNIYGDLRKHTYPRKKLNSIMISLGGMGDFNLLNNILKCISNKNLKNLNINIIQGPYSQNLVKLRKKYSKLNIEIFSNQMSLAQIILISDICIGAGGTSTWERICLGLPTITYAIAENQIEYSRILEKDGYIDFLGDQKSFNIERLSKAINSFLDDANKLNRLSKKLMGLLDGYGTKRISDLIIKK